MVDAMGAGDAMLSAFAGALSGGASVMEAAYLGNCASAIEVGHMGNIPVTTEDLLASGRGFSSVPERRLVRLAPCRFSHHGSPAHTVRGSRWRFDNPRSESQKGAGRAAIGI